MEDKLTMPEQATCKCGRPYSPLDYLLAENAKCPACGQALCLASCKCGKPLTSADRLPDSLLVWSSVVEFKCRECGTQMAVKLESRKNLRVIAMSAAILCGAIAFGVASWQGLSIELSVLTGVGIAVAVVACFYMK